MTEKKERELEIEDRDDTTNEDADNIQSPLDLAAARVALRRVRGAPDQK